MPSEDKWLLEYKPPEPKYKFKIPFITPEKDPNLFYDVTVDGFPERAVNEPDYPYLASLPKTLAIIIGTYLIAARVDPGWNSFFRKTIVKDLFEEGLGTEDVLKAEIPIILPYERE